MAPAWGQNPLEAFNREPFFYNSNFNKLGDIFYIILQSMAMNGWELVSVNPIIGKGVIVNLFYIPLKGL